MLSNAPKTHLQQRIEGSSSNPHSPRMYKGHGLNRGLFLLRVHIRNNAVWRGKMRIAVHKMVHSPLRRKYASTWNWAYTRKSNLECIGSNPRQRSKDNDCNSPRNLRVRSQCSVILVIL